MHVLSQKAALRLGNRCPMAVTDILYIAERP